MRQHASSHFRATSPNINRSISFHAAETLEYPAHPAPHDSSAGSRRAPKRRCPIASERPATELHNLVPVTSTTSSDWTCAVPKSRVASRLLHRNLRLRRIRQSAGNAALKKSSSNTEAGTGTNSGGAAPDLTIRLTSSTTPAPLHSTTVSRRRLRLRLSRTRKSTRGRSSARITRG